jgi:hypothetical protein
MRTSSTASSSSPRHHPNHRARADNRRFPSCAQTTAIVHTRRFPKAAATAGAPRSCANTPLRTRRFSKPAATSGAPRSCATSSSPTEGSHQVDFFRVERPAGLFLAGVRPTVGYHEATPTSPIYNRRFSSVAFPSLFKHGSRFYSQGPSRLCRAYDIGPYKIGNNVPEQLNMGLTQEDLTKIL